MTFFPQLPARALVTPASTCGSPPETAIFFSFPSAKNPTKVSSGDPEGVCRPFRAGKDSCGHRTHRLHSTFSPDFSSGDTYASMRPSGESASCPLPSARGLRIRCVPRAAWTALKRTRQPAPRPVPLRPLPPTTSAPSTVPQSAPAPSPCPTACSGQTPSRAPTENGLPASSPGVAHNPLQPRRNLHVRRVNLRRFRFQNRVHCFN